MTNVYHPAKFLLPYQLSIRISFFRFPYSLLRIILGSPISPILILFLFSFLSGCTHIHTIDPRQNADNIALNADFKKVWIKTNPFNFLSYQKIQQPHQPLHIYIEGDGRSYLSRHQVSPDPTPIEPLALKLAVIDPHPNVVYLARPCQYVDFINDPDVQRVCNPDIWTKMRFSETIIASMNEAVTKIQNQSKSKRIHLIGFSGGAAIATLIAAKKGSKEIEYLTTVAGDLDHQSMSEFHHTTPLDASCLNPIDAIPKLKKIPQHHLIGDKDPVVPLFISEEFVTMMKKHSPRSEQIVKRTVMTGVSHHKGWESLWGHVITCYTSTVCREVK